MYCYAKWNVISLQFRTILRMKKIHNKKEHWCVPSENAVLFVKCFFQQK